MKLQVKKGDLVLGLVTRDQYEVTTVSIKSLIGPESSIIRRVSDGSHFFADLTTSTYQKLPKIEKKEFWQIVYQPLTLAIVKGLMIAVDHKPTEKAVRDYLAGDKILKIKKVTVEYEVVD